MKPQDTARLMQSIMEAGKTTVVSQKVRDEILALTGIDLAKIVDVKPNLPEEMPTNAQDQVLACITYDAGEELRMPDNETSICGWGCGRTIQYRPGYPAWLTKVCLHCLDERPKENHS